MKIERKNLSMSAAATAAAQSGPEQVELSRLRDELTRTYNPENAHERMLVTQIAQSWMRLERAHDLERRCFEGRDMAELVRTALDQFKAITRYVTDCERAWRHAVLHLEKSQRRRLKPAPRAPKEAPSPSARPSSPAPLPIAA